MIEEDGSLPLIDATGSVNYDPMDVDIDMQKPIYKYSIGNEHTKTNDTDSPGKSLKKFRKQELELYYMEKKLNPQIEKEIKDGFFEIKKKFEEDGMTSKVRMV